MEDIIKQNEEKWDELVQLLFQFRDDIERDREARAEELGLSETEFAFHGILLAEIKKIYSLDQIDKNTAEKIKRIVQNLVKMMDEATQIVDFFKKRDEQTRVKRDITRAIIAEFDKIELVKPVTDRFMELAEVKFR